MQWVQDTALLGKKDILDLLGSLLDEGKAMRQGLPVETPPFPMSSHKIAGRSGAGRCFLLSLRSPGTELPVIAGPGLLPLL